MSTPDQLSLYNGACRELGERKLASLTEDRPVRHRLDLLWADGVRDECLSAGLWNFAMRTVQADSDDDIDIDFGLQYGFEKPADWVRTAAVCSDEYFTTPLLHYADEAGFWYADIDPIYVKYISNDSSYGLDYSKWTGRFTRYVECHMAALNARLHTQDEEKAERLEKRMKRLLKEAKSLDAMNEAAAFPPQGSWARSRRARFGINSDRGKTNTLTG